MLDQTYEMTPVDKLTLFPGNPRIGDVEAIASSIDAHGFYGSVVAQRSTGYVVAGNHRLAAARKRGLTSLPVMWIDVDDEEARRILLVDNRSADLGTYNDDLLIELLTELSATETALAGTGYDQEALDALANAAEDNASDYIGPDYTSRMDSVQYDPTGPCPPVPALVDGAKTARLTERIMAAEDVPEDVRTFLLAGAQRHLVFDYAKVAEFYAHADPTVQALMEESALVIIDFDDAILHGYVRLSTQLAEILASDLEAAEDA